MQETKHFLTPQPDRKTFVHNTKHITSSHQTWSNNPQHFCPTKCSDNTTSAKCILSAHYRLQTALLLTLGKNALYMHRHCVCAGKKKLYLSSYFCTSVKLDSVTLGGAQNAKSSCVQGPLWLWQEANQKIRICLGTFDMWFCCVYIKYELVENSEYIS